MTPANKFHDALIKAGIEYAGLSWDGFNIFGDPTSIKEVKRLQDLAGMVPALRQRILELSGGKK